MSSDDDTQIVSPQFVPGTPEARALGCLCPETEYILAAFFGNTLRRIYEVDEHCPTHRVT